MRIPRQYVLIVICCVLVATACPKHQVPLPAGEAPILLFNGAGSSADDVAAIEGLLIRNGLNYSTVDSSQLNEISVSQLKEHRLLIVPGGNFIEIGKGLTANASTNIRYAVQNGLNYLGICAGAFFASNYSGYNGLNLTAGVRFDFYSAEGSGVHKAAVAIAIAGRPTQDHYWEDGPQLSGWGAVIGKYPDGTSAIAEGTFGKGWVILAGVHPEAPEHWRSGMTFATPASTDNEYASTLVKAALNKESLPHY